MTLLILSLDVQVRVPGQGGVSPEGLPGRGQCLHLWGLQQELRGGPGRSTHLLL